MANTPNFALYKPNRADTSVEVDTSLSDNFTKIDTELKTNKDGLAGHISNPNAHTSENVSHADGSVKTTLENHEERIGGLETDTEDLETRVNDIETLGLDVLAPTLEGRLATVESDVEGFLAPATFDAMDQQSYTFDEYRIGYVKETLRKTGFVMPEDFGAEGNGTVDDTQPFKDAAIYMEQNPNVELRLKPNAIYKITAPVYFKGSPKIYGNGATVKWSGTVTGNAGRSIGALNVVGTVEDTNKFTITAINLQTLLLQNTPTNLPYYGSITVPGHPYVVGDFLILDIQSVVYDSSKLTPRDNKLVKVVRVEGDVLYIDYTNPFDFTMGDVTLAQVWKCTPATDVILKDFTFYDELVLAGPVDTINSHPNAATFVTGIILRYNYNVNIENVRGINNKFPVFNSMLCSHLTVKKGYVEKPACVGPGEGYYMQFNSSKNILVEEVEGDNARHVVDFTMSAFGTVRKSRGYKGYLIDFQTHGSYDHNLSYEECVGSFNLGSGTTFGDAVRDITYTHCKGTLQGKYAKNVTIKNSNMTILNPLVSVFAEKSTIRLYIDASAFTADSRSPKTDRILNFDNCIVNLYGSTNSGTIRTYHAVIFKNGEVNDYKKETEANTVGFLLDLKDVDKFYCDGNRKVDNVKVRVVSTVSGIDLKFNKNYAICHGDYYHFTAKYTTNIQIIAQIEGNTFKNGKTDATRFLLMRLPSNDSQTNTQSIVQFRGNFVEKGTILAEVTSTKDVYISKDNVLQDCLVTVAGGIAYQSQSDTAFV